MSESVIADDLHIKGEVTTTGDVELKGIIEGDITCRTLLIAQDARVKGSAKAEKVVVRGSVDGPINGICFRAYVEHVLAPTLEPGDIVILAAGKSSRMQQGTSGEAPHKLLAEFDGVPLIRRTVQTALASGVGAVHVVTGHRATEMQAALTGLDVDLVNCPDYHDGMASSLRAGLAALSEKTSGMLVLLADMPFVSADDLRRLAKAFGDSGGQSITRAASGNKQGNPLILPRSTFAAIGQLEGDTGARSIVASSGLDVVDVDIGDAALIDVDTREAVTEAGGVLKG